MTFLAMATILAFPCGTKIGGMKPSSQNVQGFCSELTGQNGVDRAKIRFTPCALIARKMVGKESAIGVVLVRQMKALSDRGAPRKLTTVSTPVMASLRASSSAKEPLTT